MRKIIRLVLFFGLTGSQVCMSETVNCQFVPQQPKACVARKVTFLPVDTGGQYLAWVQEDRQGAGRGDGQGYNVTFRHVASGETVQGVVNGRYAQDQTPYDMPLVPGRRYLPEHQMCEGFHCFSTDSRQTYYALRIPVETLQQLAQRHTGRWVASLDVSASGGAQAAKSDKPPLSTQDARRFSNVLSNTLFNIVVYPFPPRILMSTLPVVLKQGEIAHKKLCLFDGAPVADRSANASIKIDDNQSIAGRDEWTYSISRVGTTGENPRDRIDFVLSADDPGRGAQRRGAAVAIVYDRWAEKFNPGADEGDVAGLPREFKCLHWNLSITPRSMIGKIPGRYWGQLKITFAVTP